MAIARDRGMAFKLAERSSRCCGQGYPAGETSRARVVVAQPCSTHGVDMEAHEGLEMGGAACPTRTSREQELKDVILELSGQGSMRGFQAFHITHDNAVRVYALVPESRDA